MQRWDQYFLEGLGRGVQMAERSADREREDTYRNKVLEDTKATREEDRKTRAAEREADRKEAEKRQDELVAEMAMMRLTATQGDSAQAHQARDQHALPEIPHQPRSQAIVAERAILFCVGADGRDRCDSSPTARVA